MKLYTRQDLLSLLVLPNIEVRLMFKSEVFFSDGIPFCLIHNGGVHIRVSSRWKHRLIKSGTMPLIIEKPQTKVVMITRYFLLPDSILTDLPRLTRLLKKSHQVSKSDFDSKVESSKIRDLPNMQLKHERLLKQIEIDSLERFKLIGAEQAYKRIKDLKRNTTIELYFKLKGALEGKHAFIVKQQLKGTKQLKTIEGF